MVSFSMLSSSSSNLLDAVRAAERIGACREEPPGGMEKNIFW
jgi:hypothetical protein